MLLQVLPLGHLQAPQSLQIFLTRCYRRDDQGVNITNLSNQSSANFYPSDGVYLYYVGNQKLRTTNNDNKTTIAPKEISSLQKKQIYSFIASAINHLKVRTQIIDCIFQNIELIDIEKKILINLKKKEAIHKNTSNILNSFDTEIRQFLESKILHPSIYRLFPYSSQKYESDLTLQEIQESSKNLNTRLSNLKKINKSLITFEKNNTSLNWDDLQKISIELEENFKDN